MWPRQTTSHYNSYLAHSKTHDMTQVQSITYATEEPRGQTTWRSANPSCRFVVSSISPTTVFVIPVVIVSLTGTALNFSTNLHSRQAFHTNNDCWGHSAKPTCLRYVVAFTLLPKPQTSAKGRSKALTRHCPSNRLGEPVCAQCGQRFYPIAGWSRLAEQKTENSDMMILHPVAWPFELFQLNYKTGVISHFCFVASRDIQIRD